MHQMPNRNITALVAISFSILSTAATAADVCQGPGAGVIADNISIHSNEVGLANGPSACADVEETNYPFSDSFNHRASDGKLVTVVGQYPNDFVSSSASLGSNHLRLDSTLRPDPKYVTWADSEWADIGMIVGPNGSAPISATFTGHLDGRASLSIHGDPSNVSVDYSLGIYKTDIFYRITNVVDINQIGINQSSVPRTSIVVNHNFSMDVSLPVNTPFGMVGALSASAENGGFVDFANTGSLDRIILPQGYSFSAHGVPLSFDGTGYTYAAAVPEPQSVALLLCGLGVIAAILRRRARVNVRLALLR